MGGMRGDAKEPQLALLFQAIKGLVNIGIHEAIERVAGVDVSKVQVVGVQTLEACLDRGNNVFDRRVIAQVSVRGTEFGDDEQLVTRMALDALTQRMLGAGPGVVRRGVKVGHPPLQGALDYRNIVQTGAAERDV